MLLVDPPLLLVLLTVSWLLVGGIIAVGVEADVDAVPTTAGDFGEALLPKELPKPPKPNGMLPMGVLEFVLKLAKLKVFETGSTLAVA